MIPGNNRLSQDFFLHDVLDVAPLLVGKKIVRLNDSRLSSYIITEVEAYRGEEDEACHARFGMTARNSLMYKPGGLLYVYLIYGIHWMLNIVTGNEGHPQAVLIRALEGFGGPGKLTKELRINGSHNGLNITQSGAIWVEDTRTNCELIAKPRVGIDYAGEPWKSMPWRYVMK